MFFQSGLINIIINQFIMSIVIISIQIPKTYLENKNKRFRDYKNKVPFSSQLMARVVGRVVSAQFAGAS